MRFKAALYSMFLALFLFAGIALAQTGLQTTPYATNYFSATFDGPVDVQGPVRSEDNQSTNYIYLSSSMTASQRIVVRFVDHDIAVDFTSSDFYANDDTVGGVITNRSQDYYQGHPFTYTRHHYTYNGVEMSKRTRYIIVNSREVIFVEQFAPFVEGPYGTGDQPQWFDFEGTLNIK